MRPESRGTGARPAMPASRSGLAKVGHVAVGGGEQFGCQQMSEAGHAGDDGGEPVLLKGLFNLGVKLGGLVVEVEDVVSQARDHAGRNLLSDDDGHWERRGVVCVIADDRLR
jgi:hypothetical protein